MPNDGFSGLGDNANIVKLESSFLDVEAEESVLIRSALDRGLGSHTRELLGEALQDDEESCERQLLLFWGHSDYNVCGENHGVSRGVLFGVEVVSGDFIGVGIRVMKCVMIKIISQFIEIVDGPDR